jgi:hemerythrin
VVGWVEAPDEGGFEMPYLQWSEELAVGVADVDAQHRWLVELVNALHAAMQQGKGKAMLGSTIDRLFDYTVAHFSTEEAYFERFGYPAAAAHRLQHQGFVAKVADFKQGFDEDRFMLSLEVMDFLSDWLVEHISTSDKAFGPFLNEHGVT